MRDLLHSRGFYVDVDLGPDTLQKKIRNAEIAQYNFSFVVGVAEKESRSVNVRNRDQAGQKARNDETVKLEEVVEALARLRESRALENKLA